jgi:hypothetical protein
VPSAAVSELTLVARRFRASRLARGTLLASLALLGVARLAAGGGSHADPGGALVLAQLDDATGLCLWAAALVAAWLAIKPEHDDGFDTLVREGATTFAATRVAVALGYLLLAVALLGVATAALGPAAARSGDEALHLATVFSGRALFLVLLLAAGTAMNPYLAWILPLFLSASGHDAAYDRVALDDGLIPHGFLVDGELAVRWVLPPPLVDPLTGRLLQARAEALDQYPTMQGPGIWGTDLTAVSSAGDVLHWGIYLLAALALFQLACLRRARQVARRGSLTPLPGGPT